MIAGKIPPTVLKWLDGGRKDADPFAKCERLRDTLTPALVRRIDGCGEQRLRQFVWNLFRQEFWAFRPRPDNIAAGDQQTGFVESDAFVSVACGGNGCLGAEERLDGHATPIGELEGQHVPLWTVEPHTGEVSQRWGLIWKKPAKSLLSRWTLSNGEQIVATDDHRVIDAAGQWVRLADAYEDRAGLSWRPTLPATNSDACPSIHASSAHHCWQTTGDSPACCLRGCRRCDARPLSVRADGQAWIPSPGDVAGHSRRNWRRDDLEHAQARSRFCRSSARCSKNHYGCRLPRAGDWLRRDAWRPSARSCELADTLCREIAASTVETSPRSGVPQFLGMCDRKHTNNESDERASDRLFALTHPSFVNVEHSETVEIIAREPIRVDDVYDVEIPPHANYQHKGLTHANSGKTYCGAQKTARFLQRNTPPDRDTPYWVIAGTFEQVMQSCWFQKLRKIIPSEWVDWERVTWHSEKRGWPRVVPLLPRPGESGNWALQFKSYEQGRADMQAAAIGGAWFSEQFPWEVFEEVLRGCREFAFPGAITCEFTPIDPAKSVEMENAYAAWSAGDDRFKHWEFFFLNTEAALKAGHVDEVWFDSFFASVSEEMQETRMRGVFASYAGQIYQSWNPAIHLVDEITVRRNGVQHRRAIDWGFSEAHAFVCLWGFRDLLGTWWIYDEYYSTNQRYTIGDHAKDIRDRHRWSPDAWFGATYADPAEPELLREFNEVHGIACTGANNQVFSGIESVRNALKINPVSGRPGLIVDRQRCPMLALQMRTYRWEVSSNTGLNPKDAKPQPLKKDDHAPDALRYLIHSERVRGNDTPEGINARKPKNKGVRMADGDETPQIDLAEIEEQIQARRRKTGRGITSRL